MEMKTGIDSPIGKSKLRQSWGGGGCRMQWACRVVSELDKIEFLSRTILSKMLFHLD